MTDYDRVTLAIEENDLTSFASLIASPSFDVNARLISFEKRPPMLVLAAIRGRVAIVEQLLCAGARIDDVDDDGQTACHVAAACRHDVVVETLLAHHPNLELKDSLGRTALQVAVDVELRDAPNVRISLMLMQAGASLDGVGERFLCLCAAQSTAGIEELIRRGVVVRELRVSDGWTALHLAAQLPNNTAVLDKLVNGCGIDLDTFDERDGFTCLHCAALVGDAENLRWLIEAGADFDAIHADIGGVEPLHMMGSLESAIILIAAGADVCGETDGTDDMTSTHWYDIFEYDFELVGDAIHVLIAGGLPREVIERHFRDPLNPFRYNNYVINEYKRRIAEERLGFVRHVRRRALEVCICLQSLRLPALQTCEILQCACGPLGGLLQFHDWWNIATRVKHFH